MTNVIKKHTILLSCTEKWWMQRWRKPKKLALART